MLARALAPTLAPPPGAVVLRSDVERKALFGKGELEPLPPDAYTPEVTARVYAAIIEKARRAVAAGHSAILDAVFARPDERAASRTARLRTSACRFEGLFLEADLATRARRAAARERDASDADADVARAQETYDLGALDLAPRRRVGHAGRDLAARESSARMNDAAQRPVDKLARGTAVGLAGYCTFIRGRVSALRTLGPRSEQRPITMSP